MKITSKDPRSIENTELHRSVLKEKGWGIGWEISMLVYLGYVCTYVIMISGEFPKRLSRDDPPEREFQEDHV